MVYSTCFGLILGSILADIAAIKTFCESGQWSFLIFFGQIFGITFLCFIFSLMFGPMVDRIKRNILVRNKDYSAASVLKRIGKILLCIGPMAAAFILVFSGVSESLAKFILFTGVLITSAITGAYAKRRNAKIEKSLREGVKENSNIEEVWGNNITDHDIMDCITCDYLNRKKNLIIKHELSDVNFAAVDYVTRVSKNTEDTDSAEVISYKTKKVAKSPIICTFDKELTDAPMQLIETENPAFNKQFFTYCDNAEDAFYILTPQVMEKMIDVAKIYKRLIFNFDGEEVFIIVYQDKFMDTLANQDSQTAFADLNKMVDDLVFDDIAKEGVHVQRRKNAPTGETPVAKQKAKNGRKVTKIIIISVVVFFGITFGIAGVAMCSSNPGGARNTVATHKTEVSPEDYAPIQTYLTQKYGINFTFDSKEYNSI